VPDSDLLDRLTSYLERESAARENFLAEFDAAVTTERHLVTTKTQRLERAEQFEAAVRNAIATGSPLPAATSGDEIVAKVIEEGEATRGERYAAVERKGRIWIEEAARCRSAFALLKHLRHEPANIAAQATIKEAERLDGLLGCRRLHRNRKRMPR
jgi:hypothetical protein